MRTVERTLRNRIKWLEKENEEIKEDRQKFRQYISEKMRYFIKLTGKNEYALSPSMIEDLAKLLQKVRWFSW